MMAGRRTTRHHTALLLPATLAALLPALLLTLLVALPAAAADRDGDGLGDRFEERWGATSPTQRDSDGDGVVDSVEDPDGDRLGNLGEQRYGRDPSDPDSDADGIPDGDEDRDGDGRSDAREQDQRRLPADLRPRLADSIDDVPDGKEACLTKERESRIRPCVFGAPRSHTTVVMFGDSHASHWLPALDRAGKRQDWKVVGLVKGSCRSAWEVRSGPPTTPCAGWRRNALRWLKDHKPDVIILSNASPKARKAAAWQAQLASTLEALPERSQVVVLSDTPKPDGAPAECLAAHRDDMSACVFRRAAKLVRPIVKADKAAAAGAGALHSSLFDEVCSYDPCPLVHDDKLVYRGVHHLTATIAKQLAPSMRAIVESALAQGAAAASSDGAPDASDDRSTDPSAEGSSDAAAERSSDPSASLAAESRTAISPSPESTAVDGPSLDTA